MLCCTDEDSAVYEFFLCCFFPVLNIPHHHLLFWRKHTPRGCDSISALYNYRSPPIKIHPLLLCRILTFRRAALVRLANKTIQLPVLFLRVIRVGWEWWSTPRTYNGRSRRRRRHRSRALKSRCNCFRRRLMRLGFISGGEKVTV